MATLTLASPSPSVATTTNGAAIPLVLNEGDNAWMMTSAALVLLMTPALAFFYGGLVDRKNILNQLFLSFICIGIVFVQWVLYGFSFAFGPPISRGFGSFGYGALTFGPRLDAVNSPTYPLYTFAAYQATFAIITAALISGAIVGRMKVIPYMIFVFIWTTVCYDPMAHWVFAADGWLRHLGTLDFAGGTVVHILSGVSGYVASLILGKRLDYEKKNSLNNLPFTVLGTALLLVGWTGFNGGSANGANAVASLAVINTYAAAAAGLLTWTVVDAVRGHLSISGSCVGVIVGLVAITPACGYVEPGWSLLFGIIPTGIIYFLLIYKRYLLVDDTLDVAIVHGIGGVSGAFMTGLFADTAVNPGGSDGAFYGRPIQMWYQLAGILTAIGFGAVCTAGILIPLDLIIGIRLSPEEELRGLDHIAHGESWLINEFPKSRETPSKGFPSVSLPSYTLSNALGSRPRPRSTRDRQRQVRLRPSLRPAYSRSLSQTTNPSPV